MSEALTIQAQIRTEFGKVASRQLRKSQNGIPGVVYGADKATAVIRLRANELKKALENESFFSQLIDLTVDGNTEKVVLKSIDRHPSRDEILHIDFFRVSAKEKLTINIPLRFINAEECPGVKEGGGTSFHHQTDVEVRCLPADLPKFIEVDVGALELDQSIHLSELKLPKGVELTAFTRGSVEEQDQAVVSVQIPKVAPEPIEELEEEAEAEEKGAEGEHPTAEDESKAK